MTRQAGLLAAGALLLSTAILAAQAPKPSTLSPKAAANAGAPVPVFTDVLPDSGITFSRSFGDHEMSNIVEGTGSGACVFDYDNDGRLDIYFPQGRWEKTVSDNRGRDLIDRLQNQLFHGEGHFKFTDVTAKAGVGGREFSFGCSAADYDNDGHVDLMVLTYKGPELFHNEGNGTFTDATEKAHLVDTRWALDAAWLDYDRDGDLDVFVANYLEYDGGKFRAFYPAAGYPGPLSYNAVASTLYRNDGNGTFTDVTKEAGVYSTEGRAMSVVAADLNSDGWMDLYVANDATDNFYWENKKDGTFVNRAFETDSAFGQNGQGVSSMGPAVADIDGDGSLDILVPDMDYGTLMVKRGVSFDDRTVQSGLALICGQYIGWGAVFFDFDNNGVTDLFISNGNAHHEYPEDAVLVRNTGKGVFEDVARDAGAYFQKKWVSRGSTWADFDDDGNVDLVVVDTSGPPHLLRNQGIPGRHWIKVDAKTKGGVRTAIGARVTITAGGHRQMHDVIGVNGYLSQGDTRVHFGLGDARVVELVQVRWPDGTTAEWRNVKVDQVFRVEQGRAR